MRKVTIILLAFFCFSCNRSAEVEDEKSFDFSYAVDTLMIDPGDDDIIYLKLGLTTSALSPDQNQLFNFNPATSEMEIIDLESLEVTERIPMESEGPNGTGRPFKLSISQDGKTFFLGFSDLREFDSQLTNRKTYKILNSNLEGLKADEVLDFEMVLSRDGKYAYTAYGPENSELAKKGLAVLELQTMKLDTFPMEIWERIHAYVREVYADGQMIGNTSETAYIDPLDQRILVSSKNFNEVYILDLATNTVSHKIYHSKLTKDQAEIPKKKIYDSPEQFDEIIAEMEEQVNFGRFYYDDFNKKFWRFSRDLDRKIGDSAVYKEVVTLFDEDLNQLHEEVFPGDFRNFKFFKDGKLWSYVNVEDELGFAVFTFDF